MQAARRSAVGQRSEHVRPIVDASGHVRTASLADWPMSTGRTEWAPEQIGATMPDSLRWVTVR